MARRGDYSQPKLNARQKYLKRVEYNQQVAQLEGLYRNGATVEDVRAIRESWQTNTPYTVTDTDNLSTIAQANGVSETDVLNANPDVKQLKTGMVINTPSYTMGEKNYTPGAPLASPTPLPSLASGFDQRKPGGLPSNAAIGASMGGLSTYREGEKNYTPGVTPNQGSNFFSNILKPAFQATANATGLTGISNIIRPAFQATTNAMGITNPAQPAGTPATNPLSPTAQRTQQFTRSYSMNKDDYYPAELQYMIANTDYVPTQAQMMYLRSQGLAVPSTVGQGGGGGGGFSSNARRGGGGGRGRGGGGGTPRTPSGAPDYANTERMPAFGNGASFHGLINWRI